VTKYDFDINSKTMLMFETIIY